MLPVSRQDKLPRLWSMLVQAEGNGLVRRVATGALAWNAHHHGAGPLRARVRALAASSPQVTRMAARLALDLSRAPAAGLDPMKLVTQIYGR